MENMGFGSLNEAEHDVLEKVVAVSALSISDPIKMSDN